jgi:hypothetical protein
MSWRIRRATVFVDWDTARRVSVIGVGSGPRHLDSVLSKLQEAVARCIASRDSHTPYRVQWRFYHGWHQGKTKTADRRDLEQFFRTVRSRTIRHISFGADFSFGDSLSCGSKRNPIYDTLRLDPDTKTLRQKMVDTLLVCDLLHLVRCNDSDLYVVIAL